MSCSNMTQKGETMSQIDVIHQLVIIQIKHTTLFDIRHILHFLNFLQIKKAEVSSRFFENQIRKQKKNVPINRQLEVFIFLP